LEEGEEEETISSDRRKKQNLSVSVSVSVSVYLPTHLPCSRHASGSLLRFSDAIEAGKDREMDMAGRITETLPPLFRRRGKWNQEKLKKTAFPHTLFVSQILQFSSVSDSSVSSISDSSDSSEAFTRRKIFLSVSDSHLARENLL
jgi:hypothetical protein